MKLAVSLKDSLRTVSLAGLAACVCVVAAGCASGGSGSPGGPATPGVTSVTMLITATNNATIPIFKFNLEGLDLVRSDGTVVPVLSSAQLVELGSINGAGRPLASVQIPQGTYTAAKLTYGPSTFVVIDRSGGPGQTDIGNYNIGTPGNQPAAVSLTLGTPLVVGGTSMGVLLDLDIPGSTTYTPYLAGSSSIAPNGGHTTFNPVYSISAVTPAAQPTTLEDGLVEDVHGQVTASSAGTLTMTSDSGAVLEFNASSSTVYAGTGGGGLPTVGSFVDVDAALRQDGSMFATRVQTEGAGLQYNLVGQVLQYTEQQYLQNTGREQQGPNLPNGTGFYSENVQLAVPPQFQIAWPRGAAPSGLPFTPSVTASNIVPGQNVATPVPTLEELTSNDAIPVAPTVTLEPQTIDATVAGVTTANGETTYQVNLFANDFLALFGPSTSVTVHVTPETHSLTSSSLASGSVARFRGFLFNDSGTLRLVATEILDGVPAS